MVYILLGKGFEEIEAVTPGDLLRRAGVETAYVGLGGLEVTGSHGMTVRADLTLEQMDLTQLDMIVLPGGLGGVASIRGCRQAMEAVRFAYENGKYVAAICAAPTILAELHITDGNGRSAILRRSWRSRCRPPCSGLKRPWRGMGR